MEEKEEMYELAEVETDDENEDSEIGENDEDSGMGTGTAVLLGSVLTLGVIGLAKAGKKAYSWFKNRKKSSPKADEEEKEAVVDSEGEFVDSDSEENSKK